MTDATTATYIRDRLKELNGAFDEAALRMIFEIGVFAADDPTPFDELVDELVGDEPFEKRFLAIDDALTATGLTDAQRRLFLDLEELETERRDAVQTAAYLLGIAVGRRLGPGASVTPRRSRRPQKSR
jgi:hypothetical protein